MSNDGGLIEALDRLKGWLAFIGDKPGQYVGTTSVSNDDIRTVVAALSQPAENAKGGEVVEPIIELWALLYLHDWDDKREDGSQPFYPEISCLFISWREAEEARKKKSNPDKYYVRRAHFSASEGLRHPPATQPTVDEPVGLREACGTCKGLGYILTVNNIDGVDRPISCPSCALATPARTDDASTGSGKGDAVARLCLRVGQCQHLWSHTPTVGYFSCVHCGERHYHGSSMYEQIKASFAPPVDPVAGGEALREAVAKIIATGVFGDPWWWKEAFDDGSDGIAVRNRADDVSVADAVLAALKGPAA